MYRIISGVALHKFCGGESTMGERSPGVYRFPHQSDQGNNELLLLAGDCFRRFDGPSLEGGGGELGT